MMREIKCRGKGGLSGHWEYGFLTKKKNRRNGELNFAIAVGDCSPANTIPVLADTVGQFTGLYDAEDKEIYEDDIIQNTAHEELIYKVIWNADGWVGIDGFNGFLLCNLLDAAPFEVIGNIHDTPELLKKKYSNE